MGCLSAAVCVSSVGVCVCLECRRVCVPHSIGTKAARRVATPRATNIFRVPQA